MKKLIEVTPEWVLKKLSQAFYADGIGNVSIATDNVTDANWIELAFSTLGIPYEEYENVEIDRPSFEFEFRIEDIQLECPTLYNSMRGMNINNRQINKSFKKRLS